MKIIRKLAWALCLALLPLSYSNSQVLTPGQIYNTGELVNNTTSSTGTTSTWQNVGSWNQGLPCWSSADAANGAYCGPQPFFNNGSFNFSYGTTNVYQTANIAAALANSGNGLLVNGFNFGFMAKNGNGWDNGGQDYLAAYVNLYSINGKLQETYDYSNYTNRQYNWTQFYESRTFNTPYAASTLGYAQYGFIGRDNNGWAGPYGPEIYNISFSLKYSVDPCATNPLYSPTCSGYLAALTKLTPTVSVSSNTAIESVAAAAVPSGNTTTSDMPIALAPTATIAAATNSVTTKVGEITISGASAKTSSGPTLSTILNSIRSESTRIGAVEKSVVQQANDAASTAAAQATATAESVAGAAQATSISDSNNSASSKPSTQQTASSSLPALQNNQTNASSISLLRPSAQAVESSTSINVQSTIIGLDMNKSNQPATQSISVQTQQIVDVIVQPQQSETQILPQMYQAYVQPLQPPVSYSLTEPSTFNTETIKKSDVAVFAEIDIPKNDGFKISSPGTLNDYMAEQPFMILQGFEQTQDGMVKRNVQPNEAANGVDIATMASQPKGYDTYAVMTLKDAAFYKIEEVYKNQKTVDNVRLLRGLSGGSDRLHQEMVNQQFKIGK